MSITPDEAEVAAPARTKRYHARINLIQQARDGGPSVQITVAAEYDTKAQFAAIARGARAALAAAVAEPAPPPPRRPHRAAPPEPPSQVITLVLPDQDGPRPAAS